MTSHESLRPTPDDTPHFSEYTRQICDPEGLEQLHDMASTVATSIACREVVAGMTGEPRPLMGTYIGAYAEEHSGVMAASKILFRHLVFDDPIKVTGLRKLKVYEALPRDIDLIGLYEMGRDIELCNRVTAKSEAIVKALINLRDQYSAASNHHTRREILHTMATRLSEIPPSAITVIQHLTLLINFEVEMGNLEREQLANWNETLCSFVPAVSKENYRFRAVDELDPYDIGTVDAFERLDKADQTTNKIRGQVLQNLEAVIQDDSVMLATQAAQVFSQAERQIASQLETGGIPIDLASFPFSMAKRMEDGSLQPEEHEALTVLAKEWLLRPVQAEINALLEAVPGGELVVSQLKTSYHQAQEQALYREKLAEALEITQGILARFGENVTATAKPLQEATSDTPFRPPKGASAIEKKRAQALNNGLHQAGLEGAEKSLIMAIHNGRWQDILQAEAHIQEATRNLTDFTQFFGLDNPLHNSPGQPSLLEVAQRLRAHLTMPSVNLQKVFGGEELRRIRGRPGTEVLPMCSIV